METITVVIVRLKSQIFNEVENIMEECEDYEEGYVPDESDAESAYIKALGDCHYDMVSNFINYSQLSPLSEIEKFINNYGIFEAMQLFVKQTQDRQGKVDMEGLVEDKETFYRGMAIEIIFEEMDVSYKAYKKARDL
jgi:hypothetical protein